MVHVLLIKLMWYSFILAAVCKSSYRSQSRKEANIVQWPIAITNSNQFFQCFLKLATREDASHSNLVVLLDCVDIKKT